MAEIGRQCHDRWYYYLSPKIGNSPWIHEEDECLLRIYSKLKAHTKNINLPDPKKGKPKFEPIVQSSMISPPPETPG